MIVFSVSFTNDDRFCLLYTFHWGIIVFTGNESFQSERKNLEKIRRDSFFFLSSDSIRFTGGVVFKLSLPGGDSFCFTVYI